MFPMLTRNQGELGCCFSLVSSHPPLRRSKELLTRELDHKMLREKTAMVSSILELLYSISSSFWQGQSIFQGDIEESSPIFSKRSCWVIKGHLFVSLGILSGGWEWPCEEKTEFVVSFFPTMEQTLQPEATSHLLRAKGQFPPIGGLGIKRPRYLNTCNNSCNHET